MRNLILLLCLTLSSCFPGTALKQFNDSNNDRQKLIDLVTQCIGGTQSEAGYKIIATYDKQIEIGFTTSKARSYALTQYLASFNAEDRIEAYDKYVNCFKN